MTPRNNGADERSLGEIVSEVSERASLLVREEIELGKAEVITKAKKMGKGAGVAAAAGVFLIFAFVIFLEGLSWLFNDILDSTWIGFFVVFGILVVLAAVAGFLAFKWLKAGPPTPDMAIEEAKVTKAQLEAQASGDRDQLNPPPDRSPSSQEAS